MCANADTHYVDLNNTNSVSPYTSWSTAATNIQTAINAADTTDTVLVANGTYSLSNQISVAKAINIKSVNGIKIPKSFLFMASLAFISIPNLERFIAYSMPIRASTRAVTMLLPVPAVPMHTRRPLSVG